MTPEARQDQLLVQKVGDELVVYDQQHHRVHRLNKTAALVWRHCDGRTGVAELAALLQSESGLPADEEVVRLALARLAKTRLLRDECPEAKSITRRQVIRRLGLAGAMTLLLPVVTSIIAPTPAMAGSGRIIAGGEDCGAYQNGTCANNPKCPYPNNQTCHPPLAGQDQTRCFCTNYVDP
ncbi:MAG: PqqD family protein [Armatimonadetes bacterium]|nr:PqqD family protein [Armatimonadota bacterium]